MKRVLVIADVSNLFCCCKKRFGGGRLDYRKILDFAREYGQIYRAIAYGCDIEGEANGFQGFLSANGFEPRFKQVKIFPNTGRMKGDWDVGIAVDIIKMLDSVDTVVLCTADGDLAPVLEYIESRGKESIVLAAGISSDLRDAATKNFEITQDMLIKE